MTRQYISVSGVGSLETIHAIGEQIPAHSPNWPEVVVGIQARRESLVTNEPTKHGVAWYPSPERLSKLLKQPHETSPIARVIHFAYREPERSDKAMYDLTMRALDLLDQNRVVDGWQFNGPNWGVEKFYRTIHALKQRIGKNALLIANVGPEALATNKPDELCNVYLDGGFSHVLLDTSGGRGLPFDESVYRPYLDELYPHISRLGVGIAGGLGDTSSIPLIQKLLRDYPQLSVDAEGKLRDYPQDFTDERDRLQRSRINNARTIDYVQNTAAIQAKEVTSDLGFESFANSVGLTKKDQKTYKKLRQLHRDNWGSVVSAPGSTHNHQSWEGGYLEHILQVSRYIGLIYSQWETQGVFDSLPEEERFSFEEACVVGLLHDIEKPFCSYMDHDGNVVRREEFKSKTARADFRLELLKKYDISLNSNQQNALRYAEGMRDADYSPGDRVMSPMAALVHAADLLSARGSYNLGNPYK